MYRELRRTWSHGYANYIPRLTEVFPELQKIKSEELCDRLIELNLDFYTETQKKVSAWVRITLPFALIILLIMALGLPIKFMITGTWLYDYNDKNRLYNWFKMLRIL